MKKLALLLGVVGFMAVSCKKEVACECTVDFLGVKSTSTSAYSKLSKKDRDAFETSCNNGTNATYGIVCKTLTK